MAAQYGITVNGVHLALLLGYDERYARASPGHVLMHQVIEWAAARGLRELDFLSSASHYARWHPAQRTMHNIVTSDGSINGHLLHHAKRLRNFLFRPRHDF